MANYCPFKFSCIGRGDFKGGDYFTIADCQCEAIDCALFDERSHQCSIKNSNQIVDAIYRTGPC